MNTIQKPTQIIRLFLFLLIAFYSFPAFGFPPYQSTDAETATPGSVETRFGGQWDHQQGSATYSSPLVNINFGLPHDLEIVSELWYQPGVSRVANAATGIKWVPYTSDTIGYAIETIAHLPTTQNSNAGVESTLITTMRRDNLLLHINVGGFTDPSPLTNGTGWTTGVLTEVLIGRFRPGLEFFLKKIDSQEIQATMTAGLITEFQHFDVRMGLTTGFTRTTPDISANLWVSAKIPLFEK